MCLKCRTYKGIIYSRVLHTVVSCRYVLQNVKVGSEVSVFVTSPVGGVAVNTKGNEL